MQNKYMRFGDYIRKKRIDDPRGLTMQDMATHLGISMAYMSEVENNRRKPFDPKKIAKLAEFLNLSKEDTAMTYDLASRDNGEVPYDLVETFMYEEVGNLARFALRESKEGFITEEDWKTFIRDMEKKKKAQQKAKGTGNND